MSYYVLALIRITDRTAYDCYVDGFLNLLQHADGVRVLAADEAPKVIEGPWQKRKVVIIEFRDREAYEDFMLSPEYEDISRHRRAGTRGAMLLVEGVGESS